MLNSLLFPKKLAFFCYTGHFMDCNCHRGVSYKENIITFLNKNKKFVLNIFDNSVSLLAVFCRDRRETACKGT